MTVLDGVAIGLLLGAVFNAIEKKRLLHKAEKELNKIVNKNF